MQKTWIAILLVQTACVGTHSRPPDNFARAAESWQGFHVEEMMRVWGPPDTLQPGSATWRLGPRSARCIDRARRQTANGGELAYSRRECRTVSGFPHKCTVTASVDADGEIHQVSALSYRCERVYSDYIRVLDSDYPYNLYKYGKPDGPPDS